MVKKLKSNGCENRLFTCNQLRRISIGVGLIVLSLLSLLTDPVAVMTRLCVSISNHSYVTYKMQQHMDGAGYQIYILNVTNPEEFLSGEDSNLKLQDVGPFTYHELRTNVDVEVDSEQKTLKYTPVGNLTFIPEQSIGYPNETIVYFPNSIFLALASRVSRESFLLKTSFNVLTRQLRVKPILKMTAHDLFWGFDDPIVKLGKAIFPGIVVFDQFGMLSHAFGLENRVRYEVNTTDERKFEIISVNGTRGILNLGYDSNRKYCNSFTDAYEGMIFPPFLSPKRKLRLFHKVLCRLMELEYIKNGTSEDGHDVYEYIFGESVYGHGEENDCYCSSGKCIRGMTELSPCLAGLPVTISNGHLLGADPIVYNRLEGLNPKEELHGSHFQLHKTVGVFLKAHFTAQLNIVMDDVSFNPSVKPFSNMVVPIAWGYAYLRPLATDIHILLKIITQWLPKIVIILQILFIIIGTYYSVNTLLKCYKTKTEFVKIESISTKITEPSKETLLNKEN